MTRRDERVGHLIKYQLVSSSTVNLIIFIAKDEEDTPGKKGN